MADRDPEGKPSLELPSFGFGRKKGKDKSTESTESAGLPVEDTPSATVGPAPSTAPTPAPKPALKRAPKVPSQRTTGPEPPTEPPKSAPTSAPGGTPPPVAPELDDATHEPDSGSKWERAFPAIVAVQAVLAVGAIVGALGVLLTFSSLKFCELVTGTDSCGGPGVLLLVATAVLLTYVGSWLLRGFGIADAGSLSFLAVALLAVVVMVFFLDVIYSWWMVLVIPPVSMATFALAWWVTTRVVESDDAASRPRGVRYRE